MENNVSNEVKRMETNISDEMLPELFLNQAIKDFKKSKIVEEIDKSLKNKDKEAFLCLTEELKSLP
ncbi:IDEAL domain-containing protein [Priestia aryabhattai]